MTKTYTAPAAFSDEQPLVINMTPVESSQLAAIGYHPATKTLAVSFARGGGAVYHYPDVEPEVHAAFIAAESVGKYFGAHIKALPFKKFPAPDLDLPAFDVSKLSTPVLTTQVPDCAGFARPLPKAERDL